MQFLEITSIPSRCPSLATTMGHGSATMLFTLVALGFAQEVTFTLEGATLIGTVVTVAGHAVTVPLRPLAASSGPSQVPTTSSISTSSGALESSTSDTSSPSPVASSLSSNHTDHVNPALIAGPVIGGILLLTLIALLICCIICRRRRSRRDRDARGEGGHSFVIDNDGPVDGDRDREGEGEGRFEDDFYFAQQQQVQRSDTGHGALTVLAPPGSNSSHATHGHDHYDTSPTPRSYPYRQTSLSRGISLSNHDMLTKRRESLGPGVDPYSFTTTTTTSPTANRRASTSTSMSLGSHSQTQSGDQHPNLIARLSAMEDTIRSLEKQVQDERRGRDEDEGEPPPRYGDV